MRKFFYVLLVLLIVCEDIYSKTNKNFNVSISIFQIQKQNKDIVFRLSSSTFEKTSLVQELYKKEPVYEVLMYKANAIVYSKKFDFVDSQASHGAKNHLYTADINAVLRVIPDKVVLRKGEVILKEGPFGKLIAD